MYRVVIRLLTWMVNTFWAVVASAIILLALIVSLGRYYLPNIDAGRDWVNTQLGELLNAEVDSRGLYGEWVQLNPILGVRALQITHQSVPAVSLQGAQIEIDLLSSLLNRQLLYREVELNGLQIHLYRNNKGLWTSPLASGGGGSLDLAALYDSAHDINFVNSQLIFHDDQRVDILKISDAILREGTNLKQSELRLVDSVNPNPIRLILESTGKASDKSLKVKGFLDVDQFSFDAYRFFFPNSPLQSESLDARLWMDWEFGRPLSIYGDVALESVQMHDHAIGSVISQIGLKYQNDQLALFIHDASLYEAGKEWLIPPLRIDSHLPTRDWYLSTANIDVTAVEYWLSSPAFSDYRVLQNPIKGLKPQGTIDRLSLAVTRQNGRLTPLLSASISGASIQRWQGIPAFSNVSGELLLAGREGRFTIADKSALTIDVRPEMDVPLTLQQAGGQVYWHVGKALATVFAHHVEAEYDNQTLIGQFNLDLPVKRDSAFTPTMTLALNTVEADISALLPLIPYSLLDNDLVSWLNAAQFAGQASHANFFIHTSLSPSRQWRPAIAAQARVSNAAMNFDPGWPRIQQIAGDLQVADSTIHLALSTAKAMESLASNVHLELDTRDPNLPARLAFNGAAESADAVQLFQTSLRDVVEGGLDGWQASGQLNFTFAMAGDLLRPESLNLDIEAATENSSFSLPAADIVFTNIRSELSLEGEHLEAERLSAEVFGEPWQGGIRTVTTPLGQQYFQVYADGLVGYDALDQWLQTPLMGFAAGDFTAQAFFNFGGDEDPLLMVNSHLKGLAIDLPAPYGKAAESLYPAALRVQFADLPLLEINSPLLNLQQLLVEQGAVGNVLLGKTTQLAYELPDDGILIGGHIESFDVDEWLTVLTRYEALEANYPSEDIRVPIAVEQLLLDRMVMGNNYLQSVRVNAADSPEKWTVEFQSAYVEGELEWFEDRPMNIHLDHLHVPFPYIDETLADAPLDPEGLEAAYFTIDQLFYEDENYGSWQLLLDPQPDTLRIADVRANVRGINVGGINKEGAELEWRHGSDNITSLSVKASVNNVKDLFTEFDAEPMLTSKQGYSDIRLHWPGDPFMFDSLALTGDVSLRLRNGQFLSTEGAPTGLLKLLGVFNFDNLVRRLKFDFGDIVKEGLSYDTFQGDVELQPGLVLLEQPLLVDGPSSDFGLAGFLNLEDETIDGEITAVVPVSSNLPWAAALAGGLPAAAGVYLASKIFSNEFDRLSSARYSIKGSWEDPKIKFENLFSDKNKRSDSANKAKQQAESAEGQDLQDVMKAPAAQQQTGVVTDSPIAEDETGPKEPAITSD